MTFSFVDIETTGTRMRYDRVIEIGIIRVEEGSVVQTYNQLINPQTYLSPFIAQMTGISQEELEDAPPFEIVKDEIFELLQDSIFVAHNVRFDHGFLKNEFKRYDLTLSLKQLCTVKLSRALYPQYKRHNLDEIINRFNFTCKKRHRAFDDAEVLWKFFQAVHIHFPEETLTTTLKEQISKPSIPIELPVGSIDALPDGPGVYIFYGEQDMPLYIGKSTNIRKRVLSHFAADHTSSKEMNISRQLKRIETIATAGELGALIKEASLIKSMQPLYNATLRRTRKIAALFKTETAEGYSTVRIEDRDAIHPEDIPTLLGIFKSKKQIQEYLRHEATEHALCETVLGIEKGPGACFGYKLQKCKGACLGKERAIAYNIRFIEALGKRTIKAWPFPGPIRIDEHDPIERLTETFYVDNWCLITAEGEDHLFDYDIYKILVRYIENKQNQASISVCKEVTPHQFAHSF